MEFSLILVFSVMFLTGVNRISAQREKRQSNPVCNFNYCDFSSACLNDGTCVFNWTSCTIKCECVPGYTGSSCEKNEMSSTTLSTTSSLSVNTSVQTALIQESTSSKSSTVTSLSSANEDTPSSTSSASNIVLPTNSTTPDTTTCRGLNLCKLMSSVCLNGGTCVFMSSCKIRCACLQNYTGDYCETQQDNVDNVTITTTTFLSLVTTPTLRPLSERSCDGFVCYHGVCDKELLAKNQYKCVCDEPYYGAYCITRCERNCTENGICKLNETTQEEYCNCVWPYTGDRCQKIISKDLAQPGWVWWVVGSFTFLLVVLVLLLVLLPYWMWRKREVFIMKIVYYFQPYEDDDNKQFDAFVSYKSSAKDEEFVLRTLYPVLEHELHFKLCLHQRDFIPGETISNNIIWAVENSRRTILVLTPNYLESEFTRFEWQSAHTEMLKLKHKVVPIILDDIKQARNNMDGTMKTILDSITYIEWPGFDNEKAQKKFWKQLELSMPKKKHCDETYSKTDNNPVSSSSHKNKGSEDTSKQIIDLDISSNFLSDKCFLNNAFDHSIDEKETKDLHIISSECKETDAGFTGTLVLERNEQIRQFFATPEEQGTYASITNNASKLEEHLDGKCSNVV